MKRRIELINDPKDIVEDLELENFSVAHLETHFKKLLAKLNFKLPDRLYVPITYFVISNFVANKIKVNEKSIHFEFDPRSLGLMSPKVLQYLSEISHPSVPENDVDYSFTLDQNILNSLFIEISQTKQQISLRYLMSLFDKQLYFIKMMSTNLL